MVKNYGTLTNSVNRLNINALKVFLGTLGSYEKEFLINKRTKPITFPDRLLEKHTYLKQDGEFSFISWENYRNEYYTTKMGCKSEKEIEQACLLYIEGLQWVLTYYTKGVSNWKWIYSYSYAPFLSDIVQAIEKMDDRRPEVEILNRNNAYAYPPFMQLLCVLPKESKDLLPKPLYDLMTKSTLKEYYPDEIMVDMDGKHNDWEGVVILPPINFQLLEKEYTQALKIVDDKDKRRNIVGKSFIYSHKNDGMFFEYKSFYGDIKQSSVQSKLFE